MPPKPPRGWYSRGYLPHFDAGATTQVVTFRLADSLPAHVLEGWVKELEQRPDDERALELRCRIDAYVDRGYVECLLRLPAVAELVEGALLHFHGDRYDQIEWVVMPNHVHALFRPSAGWSLAAILHSWKSYTANQANRLLERCGPFWHPEYYDRFIRDPDHFDRTVVYIENNPVKAGLCARPEDWLYGSARRRLG